MIKANALLWEVSRATKKQLGLYERLYASGTAKRFKQGNATIYVYECQPKTYKAVKFEGIVMAVSQPNMVLEKAVYEIL